MPSAKRDAGRDYIPHKATTARPTAQRCRRSSGSIHGRVMKIPESLFLAEQGVVGVLDRRLCTGLRAMAGKVETKRASRIGVRSVLR